MHKFISYLLVFVLLLSSIFIDVSEVYASTFSESNILMTKGGTVTHPTVVLNVNTGGKAIAGVTYER
ncbi:MAG: hypothetical protein ACK5MV_03445, partial [Aminipila sp.]